MMPIYEYECTRCHRHVERLRKIDDRDRSDICNLCNAEVVRIISGTANLKTDALGRSIAFPGMKNRHKDPKP